MADSASFCKVSNSIFDKARLVVCKTLLQPEEFEKNEKGMFGMSV